MDAEERQEAASVPLLSGQSSVVAAAFPKTKKSAHAVSPWVNKMLRERLEGEIQMIHV